MIVKILGSGPTEAIEQPVGRLQSSILIDEKLLVDATPSIKKQLKDEKLEAVFITHGHKECIMGLKQICEYSNGTIPCFATATTIEWINKRLKKPECIEFREVKEGESFEFKEYSITAIPVEHSVLQKSFDPTIAWKINNLLYCEDVDYEFFYSKKADELKSYMRKADLTLLDGVMSTGKMRGHLNLFEAAAYLKKNKFKNIMFTQIGCSFKEHSKLLKETKSFDKDFELAYDGRVFEVTKSPEKLIQSREGIYLTEPQARMIWLGSKSMIVQPKLFKAVVGKPFYLVGGNNCYGIIKITDARLVALKEFKQLENKHKITEEVRNTLWAGKKKLFAYDFAFIKKYEEPRLVAASKRPMFVLKSVEFIKLPEPSELIQDPVQYNPKKLGLKQLRDDFRIALAWYCGKKAGKKIEHSIETIENLIQLIMEELLRRKTTAFYPEKMEPCAKEGYDRAMKRISGKKMFKESLAQIPGFEENLKDAVVQKDAICLVGSTVEKGKGYRDIDILVKIEKPSDFMKRAIEARLIKMLPEQYSDKLHFTWGELGGPHDSFVPLYDLVLKRTEPRVVEMQERGFVPRVMVPFEPMKPLKRFYELDKLLDYCWGA